jgi:hypothetical protein
MAITYSYKLPRAILNNRTACGVNLFSRLRGTIRWKPYNRIRRHLGRQPRITIFSMQLPIKKTRMIQIRWLLAGRRVMQYIQVLKAFSNIILTPRPSGRNNGVEASSA